jgi:hypothetical protein
MLKLYVTYNRELYAVSLCAFTLLFAVWPFLRKELDDVTLYSAKLRNPTQVATITTALDLGVF